MGEDRTWKLYQVEYNSKKVALFIQLTEEKTDKLKPFTFNVVFEPEASQEDILEHSGIRRLIDMSIDGFSATCFCYGQTGSGKTHTLTGPPHLVSWNANLQQTSLIQVTAAQ